MKSTTDFGSRAMARSPKPKLHPKGNAAKYYSYREAWGRIAKAQGHGFFLEAVALQESIITDRLFSHLADARVIDQTAAIGRFPSFSRLIQLWKSQHPYPIATKTIDNLQDRVDCWRNSRNRVIHGIVKSSRGMPTEDVTDFLEAARQAAQEGAKLARAVCAWREQMKKRPKSLSAC